jgi:polygalacturonase
MKTFTFAGTAREANGQIVFRATNRDGYAAILAKEGKTDIDIQVLPRPMSKDEAKAYTGFTDVKPVRATKAPQPAKTKTVAGIPVKAKAVPTQGKTAEEIEAIREKNLQTIRAVGKRYDQMAERLADMEDEAA